MKVKELLPIIKALDTHDRINYTVMYSLKFNGEYNSSIVSPINYYRYSEEEKIITFSNDDNNPSSIVSPINDYRCSEEEKIIAFSNDDNNPSYSASINCLLDIEKLLSDIDGETDVVFGHYIYTGKQEKTLITADDYIFSIDIISEEGYIKFDIHYDYLNI